MGKEARKKHRIRNWLIISGIVLTLLAAITILSFNVFFELLNIVMPGGGMRALYNEGDEAIYVSDFTSKTDAFDYANDLNVRICEEGIVLLKNENNVLPLQTPVSNSAISDKPKISVFGKNSVDIAYSGSGSGGANTDDAVDLYQALEGAGYDYNPVLKSFYEDESQSGNKRASNSQDLDSGDSISIATGETPLSAYTDQVRASYGDYKDAAIMVITRVGGEGFDLPRNMGRTPGAAAPEDTYLQLDQNELDLLESICNYGFERVIIVVNSSAIMELTFLTDPSYFQYHENIDACLWMGYPGNSGAIALGSVLNGSVNPSGRTVDTYAAHLKDNPSFVNFGDNQVENGDRYNVDGNDKMYYFVDYEEGIYVGYKYYETRGFTDGEAWYKDNVIYPFGYGLSYTDFSWEVVDKTSIVNSTIDASERYEVQVAVTNIGDIAGKEVVELYGHAPYYDGEIEKAQVVLVDFVKTDLLKPGESQVVTLTFEPYYLASYDYNDANNNGFSGYELDASTDSNGYSLYVSKNAHEMVESIPFNVGPEGIRYELDPVTGHVVENLYTDQEDVAFNSDTQLSTVLSRLNWEDTWPTPPTDDERQVTSEFIELFQDTTTNNPNDYTWEEMPMYDDKNGRVLRDMLLDEEGNWANVDENGIAYVPYDDERWELLLDNANLDEMVKMYDNAAFQTKAMDSIKKPRTNDTDGPVGFVNFMDKTTFYGTCSYASEVVMASTWNLALIEEFGISIGNEGIWGNADGDGMPYSGWYAPASNIHRSPFGGRNFEYYSEDGLLSGKMAASVVKGAQSKGVYCYVKHFALNEQETHRSIGGDASWVTEQAMREIYLRPFEITVKDGETRGMMSSFNRIGTRWTGGDYRLITTILRDEWGFKGMVLCDFNTVPDYMNSRQMAYAGGNLNLATTPVSWCDTSDVADVYILRQSTKDVLYTVVNSNAMNGEIIGYSRPYWTYGVLVFDGLAIVIIAIWGLVIRKRR